MILVNNLVVTSSPSYSQATGACYGNILRWWMGWDRHTLSLRCAECALVAGPTGCHRSSRCCAPRQSVRKRGRWIWRVSRSRISRWSNVHLSGCSGHRQASRLSWQRQGRKMAQRTTGREGWSERTARETRGRLLQLVGPQQSCHGWTTALDRWREIEGFYSWLSSEY